MEEGRICALAEPYPPRDPAHLEYDNDVVVANGITACRMIRLMEPAGVSGWLAVSRKRGAGFGCDDDAVIAGFAPVLPGALRFYVALEQERFASAVAGDAMRCLHFGWMALDAKGHLVEHDPEVGRHFAYSDILSKGPGGLLR